MGVDNKRKNTLTKNIMYESDEKAVCRGCGKVLKGEPHYTGKPAYHPITDERCPSNYYGGYVCSEVCDRRATIEMESSFPGAGKATIISNPAKQRIYNNWHRS